MVRLKAASVQRDIGRPFGVSGEQRRKRFIVKIVGVRCFANNFVVYTNDKKYVRYPLVPLQSVPVQYLGLYQIATYYGKLGAVEPVYKETLSYVDGI